MDIKDSYLHGTVGVVKSIDIDADKLIYKLADVASTTITITLPLATIIANGLMSKEDKIAINSLVNYVTLDTTLIISGAKTFSSLVEFTSEDGIAPFVVTSNTVVTNLNADRLDGLHSFDFIKYDYCIDSSTTTMSTRHIGYSYAEYGFMCSGPAISIGSNDGYIMQILQEANSSNTYIRYGNPDGFGAWKRLAFVGEATVSNADTVDGLHASDFVIQRGHVPTSMANVLGYGYEDEGWKRTGPIISFGDPSYYAQIQTSYNDVDTVMRINNNGVFSDWKAIAFTDGIIEFAKKFVPRYITNLNTDGINEFFSSCFQADNRPTTRNYATGFTVYNDELAFTYQFAFDTYGDVHTRYKTSTEWQPWRRLAFTTDTVAAANKLSTTRYLWGQPFDGSGDVYGDLKSMDGYNFASTTSNYVLFGYGYAQNNKTVFLDGSPIYFRYGTNHEVGMILNSNGRVGIGTSTPVSELHVVGKPIFRTNARFGNAGAMHIQNDYAINGWDRAINIYYPNMGNGSNVPIHIGAMDSEKNGGYIAYHYAGYNSDNNCMKIGLYAVDDILNVTANRCVGINTTIPRGTLDVNGTATFSSNLYLFNDRNIFINADGEGMYVNKNGLYWHNSNNEYVRELIVFNDSGYVGIGIDSPEHKLDVNGSSIFRNHIYVKKYYHIFMNTGEEGVYYTDEGLYWHNANNEYVRYLIKFNNTGDASFTGKISMDGSDQINGKFSGIALNYNCVQYVDTSIWDGQTNQIMRVFGEAKRVAIGPSAIESPQGRLNVDGDVVFENSRFITTSGFVDGEYAYFHAIYGGYHNIDVCEFYENEFKFKTNGGDITSFTLNRYYADFNGTVRSFNCDFTGVHWNGRARFRLVRDGEYNTWLQAATDTANEGGKLFMSGYNGTTLSEFNVYATKSIFSGSVNFANNTWNNVGDDVAIGDCNNSGVLGVKSLNSNIPGFRFYNSSNTFIGQFTVDNNVAKWNGNTLLDTNNAKESVGEFGYVMRKYTIDASALDENTWYPVTILLNQMPYLTVRIECIVTLDSGTKPSWSTHSAGFSVRKIWEVNGHGWGTNPINRLVYVSDSSFATTDPVRGIGQLGNDSVEYVHVRGGGKYFFYTSHNKVPILRTSTYTASNLSVSPTTTVPRTILPTVDIYQQGYTTSTSISNLPGYKQSVICTISASGTLGLLDSIPEGRELHVIIKNTSSSAITITIPSTMINVMGENLKIDGNSYGELNILSCGSYYVRGVS